MHDLLITCLLPRQRETRYRQKKVRGRLRQSESGPGNCVVFLSKTTPSWTVLSPAEKGGRMGLGLATLPRKNHIFSAICRPDIAGVSNLFETCCNFSATKIASSWCDKNRLCKRAFTLQVNLVEDVWK